jgi:hypothetical protein
MEPAKKLCADPITRFSKKLGPGNRTRGVTIGKTIFTCVYIEKKSFSP